MPVSAISASAARARVPAMVRSGEQGAGRLDARDDQGRGEEPEVAVEPAGQTAGQVGSVDPRVAAADRSHRLEHHDPVELDVGHGPHEGVEGGAPADGHVDVGVQPALQRHGPEPADAAQHRVAVEVVAGEHPRLAEREVVDQAAFELPVGPERVGHVDLDQPPVARLLEEAGHHRAGPTDPPADLGLVEAVLEVPRGDLPQEFETIVVRHTRPLPSWLPSGRAPAPSHM